ncbi:hypothetical protein IscW_ISCW009413 [Ixodes scapularis]|uniref:Uncharacterized protein n=1 Tax=Ixodes scapularis TaxID=6945 RepID=B7PZB4_IXOSC|nr:hypothetical protein IscW_ISCW009413 [Ixodes scapularis]|eukprot:XP_002405086.1 hypothetical protein IscW_ISCW009413 [Ixodes scapularis]
MNSFVYAKNASLNFYRQMINPAIITSVFMWNLSIDSYSERKQAASLGVAQVQVMRHKFGIMLAVICLIPLKT